MKNFIFLIVNYDLDINKSYSYLSLSHLKKYFKYFDVFIWDNLAKNDNNNKINYNNFFYKGTSKNVSLSEIYNYAIKNLCKNYNYLVLMDNDSFIKENYIEELLSIIKNINTNLILPKILKKDQVYSPRKNYYGKLKKSKVYCINDFGLKDSSYLFAINSGMVISCNYLINSFKMYDKRLNFYGTDDYFCYIFSKLNKNYYLMKYKMEHSFSSEQNEKIEKIIWRYKDSIIGNKILMENYSFWEQIIMNIKQLKKAIKKCIKHKDIRFITIILNKRRCNI